MDGYEKLFQKELDFGVNSFIDSMKIYAHEIDQNVFGYLDFHNDHIFNDPLLVSSRFLNKDEKGDRVDIYSLMYGYIYQEKVDSKKAYINFNNYGISQISGYGYLKVARESFYASYDKIENTVTDNQGCNVVFDFIPPLVHDNIEVFQSIHEILKTTSVSTDVNISDEKIFNLANKHFETIKQALKIIEQYCPNYYKHLLLVSRGLVLFEEKNLVSYATLFSQGTSYINVKKGDGLIFFVEEIIHQFGHNILYKVLNNITDYFKVDGQTLMSDLTGNNKDGRTFYSAFHGLFTTTKVAEGLFKMLKYGEYLDDSDTFELIGRFFYNRKRLNTGIQLIDKDYCLYENGVKLYEHLFASCSNVYGKFSNQLLNKINFEGQGFVYRHDIFLDKNAQRKSNILEMLKNEIK